MYNPLTLYMYMAIFNHTVQQHNEGIIMDTKTMYDWANEAGLKFDDGTDHNDFAGVAKERLLQDWDWISDNILDWLQELPDARFKDLSQSLSKAAVSIDTAYHANRVGEEMASIRYTACTTHAAHVGGAIAALVIKKVDELVDSKAEEWWIDICAYEHEMRTCAYEDYMEGRREDRMLEERS